LPVARQPDGIALCGFTSFLLSAATEDILERPRLLFSAMCILLLVDAPAALSQTSKSKSTSRPLVGAIRWDAWFGDDPTTTVGREVERSLGPSQWHYRLPFFAKELSPTQVQVRSNTQSVMDAEIRYARYAGIDYWAFVMYPISFPATTGGIDLYFKSHHKHDIRFCMMVEHLNDETVSRLIKYFKDDSYQTVLGGRPLVYLLGPQSLGDPRWPDAKAAVKNLRERALRTNGKNPYFVHCGVGLALEK
jgi:hypothetical protein